MKFCRPPRVSQIPSSGWSQLSVTQSSRFADLLPALMTGVEPVLVAAVDAVHGLAVDVELELARGSVPDPDRRRPPVALPVGEHLLGQVAGAVDAVHDVERAVGAGLLVHPVPQPAPEGGRLVLEPHAEQGVDGERGIPDPGEAVVPVALAADLLGQTGGRCRHESAARCVRHQLERDRRALQLLPPPSGVRRLCEPALPEVDRLVEEAPGLGDAHLTDRTGRTCLQDHAAHLTGMERDLGVHVTALVHAGLADSLVVRLADEVDGRRRTGCTLEDGTVLGQMGPVALSAVVEPGRDVDLELHLAADTPDHPHDSVAVRGDRAGNRHEVDHLADPCLGHEARDQDSGVREVQLLAGERLAGGADPEVTALLVVEQGPEDARRVEPGRAEPVDAAVGGDEGRGLEVTDEAVVGDERVVRHGAVLLEMGGNDARGRQVRLPTIRRGPGTRIMRGG